VNAAIFRFAAHDGLLDQEEDGIRLRELRRASEAAIDRVVRVLDGLEDLVHESGFELTCAPRDS
jgi:hypothetical protein